MYRVPTSQKKRFYWTSLITLILFFGIGYAFITGALKIEGNSLFKRTTWNVHWQNVNVSSGSVSGASVVQAATITGTNSDTVSYSITLTNPKDYYEFNAVAKNEGTMDAMISSFSNNVYASSNSTTPISLPSYVGYTVSYSDGIPVSNNQYLKAGQSETFKVKVYFKDDIEVSQLPSADTALSFKFNVNYVQADSNAVDVAHPVSFSTDDWSTIITAVQAGNTSAYSVGDTKTVDMGTFGTHTLRIANTTTPAECATTGFSQTACGFVLEFADIITTHRMNASSTSVGGWPATSMRTYVNTDIYNALPTVLKNAIIDTTVVTGYISSNYTSTDKIYLLSPKEVWGNISYIQYDNAQNLTRQLDYYYNVGVGENEYSGAIKKIDTTASDWWLRTNLNRDDIYFIVFDSGAYSSQGDDEKGVSPAFRIR